MDVSIQWIISCHTLLACRLSCHMEAEAVVVAAAAVVVAMVVVVVVVVALAAVVVPPPAWAPHPMAPPVALTTA